MTRLLIALTIAVLLSCFEFGWRVELPPLPRLIPQLHAQAAPTPISDNCEAIGTVGLLELYFCETDYGDLYVNSFGFMLEAN
jgi:hypothetical protein